MIDLNTELVNLDPQKNILPSSLVGYLMKYSSNKNKFIQELNKYTLNEIRKSNKANVEESI
jgi:hypothetical protein